MSPSGFLIAVCSNYHLDLPLYSTVLHVSKVVLEVIGRGRVLRRHRRHSKQELDPILNLLLKLPQIDLSLSKRYDTKSTTRTILKRDFRIV